MWVTTHVDTCPFRATAKCHVHLLHNCVSTFSLSINPLLKSEDKSLTAECLTLAVCKPAVATWGWGATLAVDIYFAGDISPAGLLQIAHWVLLPISDAGRQANSDSISLQSWAEFVDGNLLAGWKSPRNEQGCDLRQESSATCKSSSDPGPSTGEQSRGLCHFAAGLGLCPMHRDISQWIPVLVD